MVNVRTYTVHRLAGIGRGIRAAEHELGVIAASGRAAKNCAGTDFEFATFFHCLHGMGDPAGAAAHVHQEVWAAFGAQAGEAKLREMITAGGFSTVTRAH
jgi:hypothetical protein